MLGIGIGIPFNKVTGPSGTAPVVATAPVVSGLNMVGETLTTTNGTYTGSPVDSYTYQWQRSTDGGTNWTSIGTNATTYVLVTADAGNLVRCRVTAQNAFGSVENASNNENVVAQGLVNLQSYDSSKFTLVGSKISVWADQDNTKSTWVQTTDSRRPTLTSGQPIFPGSGSFMQRNAGELDRTVFSAYIVLRNEGKTTQPGIFSGSTSGSWMDMGVMWQASAQRASYRIGHSGNRIVVITLKRNGNTVEVYYNQRQVLILTNTWAGQSSLIRNIMGLSFSTGWSIAGACLATYIAEEFHTTAQTLETINALYDRYNLGSNTAIDSIVAMGDSNTVGSGSTSYIVGLSSQLSLNFTNLGISGCYMSNGGITANAVINRMNQMITRPGTDYISLCAGTNDIILGSVPVSTYSAALNSILSQLQAGGQNMSRICLSSVPYQRDNSNSTTLDEYRTAISGLSTTYGTKYFDLLQDMRDNGGNSLLNDNVHLNQTAQNRWQAGVFTALTS